MRSITIFIITTCMLLLAIAPAHSQVTTKPAMPVASEGVTITFYADQGTAGLKNYTGDIYAHTGVITSKSTSDSDWKYVKAGWTENLPACKLTRVSTNEYTLTITPSINEFYGVPSGEIVKKIALVFRSANGAKEGNATGGKDILASVYESGLSVDIIEPESKFVFAKAGSQIPVTVIAANQTTIQLFLDNAQVATQTASPLTQSVIAPAAGKHTIIAKAINGTDEATDTLHFTVSAATTEADMPLKNMRRGYNRIDETSGTLVLYAPEKSTVFVAGDFNNWMPTAEYQMKRSGDYYWLTLKGLKAKTEYAYQYWIDDNVRVADPYTNKVLDPWNDKYIPSATYPNLKVFPAGKAENLVSVFSTETDEYDWKVADFKAPDKDKLVIYELHLRDFTEEQNVAEATKKLDYLQDLGVTAVELMPINEFEGNNSWGYNPSLYFAPDKYYGTPSAYRKFVDECHKRGMAVIIDLVLNHSFGQSPFVKMYWDDENSRPAANNPWYNQEYAIKNTSLQWGYDFNHESAETKNLVDSICSFWMSEYKIDGFRYDFTKGFTNKAYPASSWASEYDASRIAILKRMATEVWKRKSDAYVIFEHLSDNSEEKVLADHGIMLWGNCNTTYNEATMGWNENSKSNFSWISYKNRSWSKPNVVGYMESHDEERLMYKSKTFGNRYGNYNVRTIETSLARCEAAAAMFITIPGPKMVWQFGEMGYDISIDENGRTGEKPVKWDYMNITARAHLIDVYRALNTLKATEDVFSTTDFTISAKDSVKTISLNATDNNVRIVANFGVKKATYTLNLGTAGRWYDYFNNTYVDATSTSLTLDLEPGEYHLYSQKDMGEFETPYTKLCGIEEVESGAKGKLAIYPVPAINTLNVATTLDGAKTIEVYSLDGALRSKAHTNDTYTQITVSQLPQGVYILRVATDEETLSSRFIKF